MIVTWNVGKVASLVPVIFAAVMQVEAEVNTLKQPGLTGPQKKAAALDIVKTSLGATEGVAGRDLVDDADVLQAAGGVIDAVVALHNIATKKSDAAPTPAGAQG